MLFSFYYLLICAFAIFVPVWLWMCLCGFSLLFCSACMYIRIWLVMCVWICECECVCAHFCARREIALWVVVCFVSLALVTGLWSLVPGPWSLVSGLWPVLSCPVVHENPKTGELFRFNYVWQMNLTVMYTCPAFTPHITLFSSLLY